MQRRKVADKVKGLVDSALDGSQAVSKKTLEKATPAVHRVKSTAGNAMDVTASAAGDAFKQLKSLSVDSFDKVFPECPVPAFMMPTGPSAEDYVFVFRLSEVLDNLKAGILVRPKIEVWTGREADYDLEHFGQELVQDFSRQFNEARDNLIEAHQSGIDALGTQKTLLSNEMEKKTTDTLGSVGRWMAVDVFLPGSVTLIGVALNLHQLPKLLRLYLSIISTKRKRSQAEDELKRELKKMESRISSKNKAFTRALKNIEVRVHPQIQPVVRMICEVEGQAFFPSTPKAESDDIPDIRPYLRHSSYLERLPQHYRRLVDLEADLLEENASGRTPT